MQMDLVDLSNISKQNRGIKFLLTAIDIFSRKAFVVPLKNKTSAVVRDAIAKIFTNYPPVRYVQTDLGTEFYNRLVKTYLASRKIHLFSTSSDVKCSLIERFHRTLKQRMFRYFTAHKTVRYIDVLDKFVASYNARKHRSIGIAPNDVTHENQSLIWKKQYGKYFIGYRKKLKFKYSVGDRVRVSKLARQFRKGYLPAYTKEIFIVHNRIATAPVTYHLRDTTGDVLVGSFYEPELQLTS